MKLTVLSRRRLAVPGVLLVSAGLFAAPSTAYAADPATDFQSSFESADPPPTASTTEVDASGRPVQGNLTGSIKATLPGSVLDQVTAVTASAENPPNENAVKLKDSDS